MGDIHVEASRVVNAPPARVYAVLADYRVGHPSIVPKAKVSPGFAGWMERMVNPFLMRKIYNEELQPLAEYVARPAS